MKVLKRLFDQNQIAWSEIASLEKELVWFFNRVVGFNEEWADMNALSAVLYLTDDAVREVPLSRHAPDSIHPERFALKTLFNKGVLSLEDLLVLKEEFKNFYYECIGFNDKKATDLASVTVRSLSGIESLIPHPTEEVVSIIKKL